MADQREGTQPSKKQSDYSGQRQPAPRPVNDLDSSPEDAERVKGGALPRRVSSDPCEGGE